MHKRLGFSLIELMVVIAIVAVLAAVAVPAYKNYVLKTKIALAVSTLNTMTDKAISDYTNGQLGTTNIPLTFGGVSFGAPVGNNALNASPVVRAGYWTAGSLSLSSPVVFVVCVYVSGLDGISVAGTGNNTAYVAPTATTDGQRCAICTKVSESSTGFTRLCGSYNNSNNDFPPSYGPSGCNCNNVSTGAC